MKSSLVMWSNMGNVVRCGMVGSNVVRGMMWSNMMRCGMMGSNMMRGGMMGIMMRSMRVVRMFLLSMNERVVIRIQVEFVESGLSFAVDFEPMVALKSLLVEEGAIRA